MLPFHSVFSVVDDNGNIYRILIRIVYPLEGSVSLSESTLCIDLVKSAWPLAVSLLVRHCTVPSPLGRAIRPASSVSRLVDLSPTCKRTRVNVANLPLSLGKDTGRDRFDMYGEGHEEPRASQEGRPDSGKMG